MKYCTIQREVSLLDWSRAKTVMILCFLLLNLLLGYQLWSDVRTQFSASSNSAELPSDKLLAMQQKRITLATNLPPETPLMGDLTYILDSDYLENRKIKMLEPAVDSALFFIDKQLNSTLGGIIPELQAYVYDVHSSRDGVFVMHRLVDKRPMFHTKLEFYYSDLKMTGYLQDRVEIIRTGDKQKVLGSAKVLSSLIDSYLAPGAVIVEIKLGYYGQIFDSEVQVATPTWRIALEDGTFFYVDAISGEVLTDNIEDKL